MRRFPARPPAVDVSTAAPDATTFALTDRVGSDVNGICSNPFLQDAFGTLDFRIRVGAGPGAVRSYEEDTVRVVLGRDRPCHHADRETLRKVGVPPPSPLARAASRWRGRALHPERNAKTRPAYDVIGTLHEASMRHTATEPAW